MRVLVLEPSVHTAAFLRKTLSEDGSAVDVAYDSQHGLERALRAVHDVLIVSANLPPGDGQGLVTELRRRRVQTPTIILGATDSVDERVRSLNLGADDYLTRPFATSELIARLRALSRRRSLCQSDALRVADLEVDVTRQTAYRAGQKLTLTPKEFRILWLLASGAGTVIPRSLITEQVWGADFRSQTNFLSVHVRRLRAKLDDPFPTKLIRTVKSVGYSLQTCASPETARGQRPG